MWAVISKERSGLDLPRRAAPKLDVDTGFCDWAMDLLALSRAQMSGQPALPRRMLKGME